MTNNEVITDGDMTIYQMPFRCRYCGGHLLDEGVRNAYRIRIFENAEVHRDKKDTAPVYTQFMCRECGAFVADGEGNPISNINDLIRWLHSRIADEFIQAKIEIDD